MSGKYKVDTTQLGSEADRINSLNSSIQGNFNKLTDEVRSLSAVWEGFASNTFMASYNQDCESISGFLKRNAQFYENAKKGQGEYNRGEHDVDWKIKFL